MVSNAASQIRRLERLREDALTELAMLRAQRATYEQDIARVREQRDAAYERGLRRGMAIARRHEWERAKTVDWTAAEAQMEREIEEAKR